MKVALPAGKYVVAVSGGVDSVVLLDMLTKQTTEDVVLVVAHFDHGIRPDSHEDRKLVEQVAQQYQLPFYTEVAQLGAGASEAVAREARYAFLRRVKDEVGASAIVMAHHQDDVLETIIINFVRGTKSKGLSSLRSTDEIVRPLLHADKAQIRAYAKEHNLHWREDSTNDDETYLRNYIRKRIMPRLTDEARAQLIEHSTKASVLNSAIDELVAGIVEEQGDTRINRAQFRTLPHEVAAEVMASWLRKYTSATLTTKLITRLSVAVKEARNGAMIDIAGGQSLKMSREYAELVSGQ